MLKPWILAVALGGGVVFGSLAQAAYAQPGAQPAPPRPAAAADAATNGGAVADGDEAAIRAQAARYAQAYNQRNAAALAALFSPEAMVMLEETAVVGRAALQQAFAEEFADEQDRATLQIGVAEIKFVSPNAALLSGAAQFQPENGEPHAAQFSAVFIRQGGQWLLDRLTSHDAAAAPSHYEHLKELEWLIGEWQSASGPAQVTTAAEWTRNRNFIRQSFSASAGGQAQGSGMQIIGWDPAAKTIRSWVFDSEGGFAEGTWTRKGSRWMIQQTGVLPDGSKSTAVNILTQRDDHTFSWQSTHREIDGELQPNIPEVTATRQP